MSIFCPSVMCLKMDSLKDSIRELEESGIDRFHLDVMDGVFVPNYALGFNDVEAVCRLASVKSEVHLMTVNPGRYIKAFAGIGADIIYIHPESLYVPSSAVQQIIEAGMKPGIVLSPSTSVESVMGMLGIVEHVLVMMVNPGATGQVHLPYVDGKIKLLLKQKEKFGFELGLDGACTAERIAEYSVQGVDSFVLGTAALFHKKSAYAETVARLREIDGQGSACGKGKRIRFFVTDVDGTLTDGKIYMGNEGEQMKAFDIKDGYALHEMLPAAGIEPVIITGRKSEIVENRARELKIKRVFQGTADKAACLSEFLASQGSGFDEIAYIGDDENDLECIMKSGISGCPADAAGIVKRTARHVSVRPGGAGAVRDFAEHILKTAGIVAV